MQFHIYPASPLPVTTGAIDALVTAAVSKGLKVITQRRGSLVVEGDPSTVQQLSPMEPGWDIDPVRKSAPESSFAGTLQHLRKLGE